MLTGSKVAGPVAIDAEAGIWMDVVKPWITTGTIAPGVSEDSSPKTSALDGMLSPIEVTSGGGPVTVKIDVRISAGGMMVVVAPALVMYSVTVVTPGGVVGKTTSRTSPRTVTEYVARDCAVMSAGAPRANPRHEIAKNMLVMLCKELETVEWI